MNRRSLSNAVMQGALATLFVLVGLGLLSLPVGILLTWAGGPRATWALLLICAIVSILFGILTTWGALRLNSERRRAEMGQCRGCGYDLRGSDGRCPECGQIYARRDAALYYDQEGSLTKTHALQTSTPQPPGQATA